ncbi:hypothetical protein BGX29_001941 [Mortierella sp. GBA35]|nr:hypothetical protein BGX29_001941 [Mortierella sp. GBA35]
MNSTIPNYAQPCLAADNANSAVYLVGVPAATVGRLEINYVSVANINSPSVSTLGYRVDTESWASGAPKACFTYPSEHQANTGIKVVQFTENRSYMSTIRPDGTIGAATRFLGTAYTSPKPFTLSGSFAAFDVFSVFTNTTSAWSSSRWMALRLSFTEGVPSYREDDLTNYPTMEPLVAVGTYSSVSGNLSKGYSIVFDTAGKGQAFPALGNIDASLNSTMRALTLDAPTNVNMNGITLTKDAIPVTMASTGYILDKAPDGSTVVYSITPEESATLKRVTSTGGTPPFSASMAATALNKQIVIYIPSIEGAPTFNSFDTTTGSWNDSGLITAGGSNSATSAIPLDAIIGGAVGGLMVIALAMFVVIRYRRRRSQQKPTLGLDTDASQESNGGPQFDGNDQARFPLYQLNQQIYYQQQPNQEAYLHSPFLQQQQQQLLTQEFYFHSPYQPPIIQDPSYPDQTAMASSYELYQPTIPPMSTHVAIVDPAGNPHVSLTYDNLSTYKQPVDSQSLSATRPHNSLQVKPQSSSPQYIPPDQDKQGSSGRSPQLISRTLIPA